MTEPRKPAELASLPPNEAAELSRRGVGGARQGFWGLSQRQLVAVSVLLMVIPVLCTGLVAMWTLAPDPLPPPTFPEEIRAALPDEAVFSPPRGRVSETSGPPVSSEVSETPPNLAEAISSGASPSALANPFGPLTAPSLGRGRPMNPIPTSTSTLLGKPRPEEPRPLRPARSESEPPPFPSNKRPSTY